MLDIHCHLLFGVDDGPKTIEESIAMLEYAKKQGIDTIILTPHYRRAMFPFEKEKVLENAQKLQPHAQQIGIDLYIGTEFHVNSDIVEYLETGRCLTLAGSSFVLMEYEYDTEYSYIHKMTQELMLHGYTPVIAHVERYGCLVSDIAKVETLKEMGAFIQVNADAILGNDGWRVKQFCKKLFKYGLVDIVASDSHGIKRRVCNMEKCRNYIAKKYGESVAVKVTEKKPGKILGE
uniref:CpsB/CapC family capsule biosynthesis tyrosine phosphatase n=1 Tax=Agathobacter sp. TaxID=2021311 RepID=UPI004056CE9B